MELDNLREFYRSIWRDTPGLIHMAAKGGEPNDWHSTLFSWPQDEQKIIDYTQRRAVQHEVFVNPVLYKDNGIRDKSVLSRDNVLGTWVLWADFDGNARSNWTPHKEIPQPSFRIITSTESHQHCYWQLSELLTDPDAIEAKNRTIAYSLDADKSGWDYSQLLRPPDTTNHSYGKSERKGRSFDVRVEETSNRTYTSEALVENDDYRPVVSLFPSREAIPAVTKILSEHTYPQAFLDLFNYRGIPGDRSGALIKLGYLAAETGLADIEMYSVLNYADSIWGKYVGRNDHDQRLVGIIDKVRRTIPFGLPAVQFGSVFGDVEIAPKSGFSFSEFMALDVNFNWIFEGLIPQYGAIIFYGSPGVGKTLLGMDFVNAAITGQDWLCWKCTNGVQKVLFLSLEMNQPMLKEQYLRMTIDFTDEIRNQMDDRLRIYPLAETLPLDKPEGKKYLTQILSETDFKPDILLIDSMSELSEKSLQDDEAARNLNRFLRHIRNRYNVAICIIHHNRKSGKNSAHSDLDDMWGSRFLGAGADTILYFEDTDPPGDAVLCTQDKSRMSRKTDPFEIHRDWNTFKFTFNGDMMTNSLPGERESHDLRSTLDRVPGIRVGGESDPLSDGGN